MGKYHAEIITYQCQIKALEAKVASFESEERYTKIQEVHQQDIKDYEKKIAKLESQLFEAHTETVNVRNLWFEVFADLEKDFNKQLNKKDTQINNLEKQVISEYTRLMEARDEVKQLKSQLEEKQAQLDEANGIIGKLRAQINRDYENSSIPSSQKPHHKKIVNSREHTGRKPGGQLGHAGHRRKKQLPTQVVQLPPPDIVKENPDIRYIGKEHVKQLVSIRCIVETTEYHSRIYYNPETRKYIYTPFPDELNDDVVYDGSIKAFLYLLNNDCHMSIDKARRFLYDISDGKLDISKGMVSNLTKEFSKKTESQRRKVYSDMLLAPVLHVDNTNAKVNGKSAYVFVCAQPEGLVQYFARERKGHQGVKDSIVEDYQGILIHDHDVTFYNYGVAHQECNAHILRYLKDSMQNEPNLTWNKQMHALIQEIIHYINSIPEGDQPDSQMVSQYEARYKEIIEIARKEYEKNPPTKYYQEGYNLFKRMDEYMQNHLLFLHDTRVPPTNNKAERLLRQYKRKQVQAISFRSFESLEDICNGMSVLCLLRQEDDTNVYKKVSDIFA
jgi:hypothetical protein